MAAAEIDIKYVAHLARLQLAPDEEKKLGAQLAGIACGFHELGQQCQQWRVRHLDLDRVGNKQPWSKVSEQRQSGGRVWPGGLVQQLDGNLEPLERIGVAFGGGTDLVGGPAQRVFEKREQQLVLAVKLQVEAPQRLAGAVHDLLDGKVCAALFDDDGLRRVEETLNALRCPQFRGLDGPLYRTLLPGGLFARAGHGRLRRLPRGENMVGLYRRTPCHQCARPPSRTSCRRL